MLTTSSWWSTLIPFSRSVLTISKWPSAAARWRAVCPVCNKQSKREIKFHENEAEKKHTQQKKISSNRSFWGTQTCPKNAQQRWFLHNICCIFFLFQFSCFSVCVFALCLSSISVVFLKSDPDLYFSSNFFLSYT